MFKYEKFYKEIHRPFDEICCGRDCYKCPLGMLNNCFEFSRNIEANYTVGEYKKVKYIKDKNCIELSYIDACNKLYKNTRKEDMKDMEKFFNILRKYKFIDSYIKIL